MKKGLFKSRKFKYGSTATAVTIIFVAIVVVINIVASLIIDRFPADLDLTADSIYKIGEDSEKILDNLKTDIAITVIGDKEELSSSAAQYKQISEIIEQYAKSSAKVDVEYINLDENPEFANQYSEELKSYDVIVKSDMRYKILSITEDMIGYEYQGQSISASDAQYYSYYGETVDTVSNAEQELTSAIMYVSDENPVTVDFITAGDNVEDYYTTLKGDILEKNSYTVETVNILTQELNNDAQIAVLAAPVKDFTSVEIAKLEKFLDNEGKSGKTLVYIASSKNYETPLLDEFLTSWGIEISDSYVVETDSNYYYQSQYNAYNEIVSFDYAKDFDQTTTKFPVYLSHPVNQLFTEQGDITTTALITTNSTATLKTEAQLGQSDEDLTVGEKGTYNTAVLSCKTNYSNNENKSYVIAFATEYMFGDYSWTSYYSALNDGAYYSSYYLLSMFNTITGKTSGVTIVAKSFSTEAMTLSTLQSNILGWTFVAIIPLIVVVLGIVIHIKRKNR